MVPAPGAGPGSGSPERVRNGFVRESGISGLGTILNDWSLKPAGDGYGECENYYREHRS